MQPMVLKPRKSYREQYLFRMELQESQQNSFMERRQSTPPGNKKTLIPILKSRTGTRVQKHAKRDEWQNSQMQVKEAAKQGNSDICSIQCKSSCSEELTQQGPFTEFEEDERPNTDAVIKDEDKKREEIKQFTPRSTNTQCVAPRNPRNGSESHVSSGNLYREMISKYAKALNLNEFERECLGFNENDSEIEIRRNQRRTVPSNCRVKFAEQQGEKDHASSTWANLYDHFLKNWFAFPTTDPNNNDVDNNGDNERNINVLEDYEAAETDPNAHENTGNSACSGYLITSGILNLIDNVCEGDHSDGTRNCFKCQYKESFKSFTMYHLNVLERICRNKELSLQQQDQYFNETLENWVYQLSEQNMSLADAYSKSVQESDKLKSVLPQYRNSMRALQKENDRDKACIDALNYELSLRDKTIKKLKYEHEIVLEQMRALEDSLQDAQADVSSLTELILRLRDKGVWDINGLPMGDATFNKIFNGNYYLHGAKVIGHKEFSSKKREWKNEIELLKSEMETLKTIIAAKDKEIQRSSRKSDPSSCRVGK